MNRVSLKKMTFNTLRHLNAYKGSTFLKVPLIVPYHHTVSDVNLPHIRHLYAYKNEREFESDVAFFTKHFTPVSVDDLLNSNGKTLKRSFLLTFDDGCREVYDIILPILEKYNVKGVFFLNSAFLDNKELFTSIWSV